MLKPKRKHRPHERNVTQSSFTPRAWKKIAKIIAGGLVSLWIVFVMVQLGLFPFETGAFPVWFLAVFSLLWGVGAYGAYDYGRKHAEEATGEEGAIVAGSYAEKQENEFRATRILTYDPLEFGAKALTPALRLFGIAVILGGISMVTDLPDRKAAQFQQIAFFFVGVFTLTLIWKLVVYVKYQQTHSRYGKSRLHIGATNDLRVGETIQLRLANAELHEKLKEVTIKLQFVKEEIDASGNMVKSDVTVHTSLNLPVSSPVTDFDLTLPDRVSGSDFDPTGASFWELEATNEEKKYYARFLLPVKA